MDLGEILEEDDRKALAGVSNAPPHRKAHSYSQQLRSNTGTHHKKRLHQIRKHSLDEDICIPKSVSTSYYQYGIHDNISSDDDDDGFYPYSTSSGGSSASLGGADRPEFNYVSHNVVATTSINGGVVTTSTTGGDQTSQNQQVLPEFVSSGGGAGMFRLPFRAAVHPTRPSCLELRPHPLRETQVNKALKTIACTETQLWAGQESGVRVWNFSDAYEPGCGMGGRARRGDENAAPFYESANTSPTTCLIVDRGSKLVWSGHKDGRIRSWKILQSNDDTSWKIFQSNDDTPFKEGLSWQAHRTPVLSMAFSSYGDLWSGSTGGAIIVWPWESLEKSLSMSAEERRMAALLVERSSIDLRSQVTVNGVCNISSSEVKCLLSDTARSKMWAAGSFSFSLWDARTRELVKVFNIDGQIENRADVSSVQDQSVEDEMNVKFVSKPKKDKSQGSSFLQRSRNAIMGAADAVRRVAKGAGAFVEDTKKTEAIVLAADGMIWSGCSNGLLVQWDGNGNRIRDFNHHHAAVQCFCAYGSRIWVGYASGILQVFNLEGNLLATWLAHNGQVIKLAAGNGYVFSLANHGGIRGWGIAAPGPIDNILRVDLAGRELLYTTFENVKLLVGTWNVGQGRASHDALVSWLGSSVSDVGIVVVGLQEVEMGAGFLAMSAAKETVGLEGSAIGQLWQDNIGKALEEGSTFERVGSRQLAGLLIAIWVRKTLRSHVGDLDVGAVACGLGRAIGNKGGVGLRLRVFDRIMCFANCHFAAHLEAVNRRNADFNHIFRTMAFTRSSSVSNNSIAGTSSSSQPVRGANGAITNLEDAKPDLSEADLVIFCGDFNYRLFGISYDEARDFVSQRSFDWLREKDQLREEMKMGKVFQGMREALIRFPPTYKFERGKAGLGGYDSGEKKRIPAWCDRILYRDNRASPYDNCSLQCPVVCSILQYDACMDVTESDHKPVRCKLNIEIAHVDRSVRRQEFGKILESNTQIRSALDELRRTPEIFVSANKIVLQNQDSYNLRITNRSGEDDAVFEIICEGQSTIKEDEQASDSRPRGSSGFPHWLEVTPAAGVIKPDQVAEITVRHDEFHTLEEFVDGIPQSWWSENTRDKEVILLVNVRGSCSTGIRTHQINVRHHFSNIDSKANNSSLRYQGGSHRRSDNTSLRSPGKG